MSSRIRNTIRNLRVARSMTQQELADLIFVSRQTVVAIEGDKYSPSLEVAFRIARVFDVSLERIFEYDPLGTSSSQFATQDESKGSPASEM